MLSEEVYRCSNEIFSNLMKSFRNNTAAIPHPHGFVSSYATSYSQTSFSSADSSNTTSKYITAQMAAFSPMNMLYAVFVPVPVPYIFSQQIQALAHVSSVPQRIQGTPVVKPNCTPARLSLNCQPEWERNLETNSPGRDKDWGVTASPVVSMQDVDKQESVLGTNSSNRGELWSAGASRVVREAGNDKIDSRTGTDSTNWQSHARYEYRTKKDLPSTPPRIRRSVRAYSRNDVQEQKRPFVRFPARRNMNQDSNSPNRHTGRRLKQQRQEKDVPSPMSVATREKISLTLYVKRERDQDGKLLYTDESSSSSCESDDDVVVGVVEKSRSAEEDDGFYMERICDALERSWKEDM